MTTAAAGDSFPQAKADLRGDATGARGRRRQPSLRQQVALSRRRGVSYRASLIVSLSLLVVATGLSVSLLAFRGTRAVTEQLAHDLFREVSDHAVTKSRTFLQRAVPIARAVGDLSHFGLAIDDPNRLASQLVVVLRANDHISWLSYSNEAGDFVGAYRTREGQLRVNQSQVGKDGRTSVVEHDVLDDGSWRYFRADTDSKYDPRTRPFYVRAKQAKRIVWTPPYVFYDQGVAGVTCANPIYQADGSLRGVLTVDFDLDTLSGFVAQQSVSPNSRMFIIDQEGTLLAHPANRALGEAAARARAKARVGTRGAGSLLNVREMADPLLAAFDKSLSPDDRMPGKAGADHARQFDFRVDGVDYYARATAFTIDGELTWILGAVAPQSDFLAAARRTSAMTAAASLGALLVAVFVATLLARRVSGPILSLVSFMDDVRDGDLSTRPAALGGAREFRQLSSSLDRMLHDLREGTRLRGAMAVASEVQQGLLPARPPRMEGLDVHGFSTYCDETGGDYFDYLVLDRDGGTRTENGGGTGISRGVGLLVAIGDVVGHGIGSALVMAGARAILHSHASGCGHLGRLMTHLNEQLVPDLAGCRFVTMLLWYIDPRRGTVCWANAGHDPAIIYDPQADTFEETDYGNIPLGIDGSVNYKEHGYGPVRPGQVIVLGTDGVWETMNESAELYGRERLKDVIRAKADRSSADIAAAVQEDLDKFRGASHQRDDVTLVVIKMLALDSRGLATSPNA